MIAIYNGMLEVQLDEEEMASFYQDTTKGRDNKFGLVKNQYLLIKDEEGNIVDQYKWDGYKLMKLSYDKIRSQMLGEIKPRNIKQRCYFDLLNDINTKVKVVTGKAGTGKSFIASNWAVEKLREGKFSKLIVLRNNIQTRGIKEIGFRKGDTNDKLAGYAAFLRDIISPENFDQLLYDDELETPYLGEIRGRSFSDAIVYLSEGQDVDVQVMKTIVTRVGEGSVLIIDGDYSQCDSIHFEDNFSGLKAIARSLSGHPLVGMVELDKCERSEVAALAELII